MPVTRDKTSVWRITKLLLLICDTCIVYCSMIAPQITVSPY
eukprot:XP_001708141.1 Hypothetical protein GL50803_22502 [Giardia lamblia ATCC 50803]